jgi:hypothetical protein
MKFSCYLFGILCCFLIATPAMAGGSGCKERTVLVAIKKSPTLQTIEGVEATLSYCRSSQMAIVYVNKTEITNFSGMAKFTIKGEKVSELDRCVFKFSYLKKGGGTGTASFSQTFETGCNTMEMEVTFN